MQAVLNKLSKEGHNIQFNLSIWAHKYHFVSFLLQLFVFQHLTAISLAGKLHLQKICREITVCKPRNWFEKKIKQGLKFRKVVMGLERLLRYKLYHTTFLHKKVLMRNVTIWNRLKIVFKSLQISLQLFMSALVLTFTGIFVIFASFGIHEERVTLTDTELTKKVRYTTGVYILFLL